MIYRVGNHNPALVYRENFGDARGELVAVFVAQGGEHELDALHYVRAMNATMPACTCRVICCCGALVGTTSGCESCAEHNGECAELPAGGDEDALNSVEALRSKLMSLDDGRGTWVLHHLHLIERALRARFDA
jgi:hypothetical protein